MKTSNINTNLRQMKLIIFRMNKISGKTCVFVMLGMLLPFCKKKEERTTVTETKVVPADYLSSEKYQNLNVDLIYDAGNPPSAELISNLKTFLQNRLNKPGGIQIISREISGNTKEKISLDDVKSTESKRRNYWTNGNNLAAFVYFVNSGYDQDQGNTKVLGMQYASSSVVLFARSIQGISGGLGQPSRGTIETAVAEHEFGHLLGLVNHGSSMVKAHEDLSHEKHCNNNNCLMYYMAETSDIIQNILGTVPTLDQNCLDDLKNNGGK